MITNRLNQLVVPILVLSVCALSGIGFLGLATASANEEPNTPDPKPVSIKASKQEASKSDFKNVETTILI